MQFCPRQVLPSRKAWKALDISWFSGIAVTVAVHPSTTLARIYAVPGLYCARHQWTRSETVRCSHRRKSCRTRKRPHFITWLTAKPSCQNILKYANIFAASFFLQDTHNLIYIITGTSMIWYVRSRLVRTFKRLRVCTISFRDQGSVIQKKTFVSRSHPKWWHVVTAECLNARWPSRTSTKRTQAVSPRKSWQTSLARTIDTIDIVIVNQDEPSLPVYVAQCSTSACQALHWSGMQKCKDFTKLKRSEKHLKIFCFIHFIPYMHVHSYK